jgi:diamine N-acetyltransferase
MRTESLAHHEPTTTLSASLQGEELARQSKQRETMTRVLANSLVNQLLQSGCGEGDVINLASQILHYVTSRGFGNGNGRKPAADPHGEEMTVVEWRLEPAPHDRHFIAGPRVTLRPLESPHLPYLRRWQEDPEIQRTCSAKLLSDLLQRNGRRRDDHLEYIIHNERQRPIGLVALFQIDPDAGQAEMAKLLGDPAARGSGYASEATGLLLAYAFEILKLHRVYLRTKGFNLHNIQLNEKLGFQFEGILRASDRLQDELIDVVLMSMLAREFASRYEVRERQVDPHAHAPAS